CRAIAARQPAEIVYVGVQEIRLHWQSLSIIFGPETYHNIVMSDRLIRDFGSRRKRRNFLLASLLFGAVVLDAQTPGTPTFRSSVNYVDVDVTVTDAQGRFVGDLSRDDFEVLEDG